MIFLQHCQCVKAGCFWLTPAQLIEEHCQLRAGNGYFTITHRRPDKLTFFQAFGGQAQTISISPEDFKGVTPSATKDEQVTGEGFSSSTCCICSPRPLKDLRISVTPATSQMRVPDGSEIIFPSRSVHGTVNSSGEGFSSVILP
ncbi:hypothetical protein BvCms6BK_00413 [Escherichia coli]|nr:hypothetical protein BvCms6BK_00413 [Escherichia coli]